MKKPFFSFNQLLNKLIYVTLIISFTGINLTFANEKNVANEVNYLGTSGLFFCAKWKRN